MVQIGFFFLLCRLPAISCHQVLCTLGWLFVVAPLLEVLTGLIMPVGLPKSQYILDLEGFFNMQDKAIPTGESFNLEDGRRPTFHWVENRVIDALSAAMGPYAKCIYYDLCRFATEGPD